MRESRPSRATGLAAELLVIIAGVLIALGADAWWQGRQEAESERAYLILVRNDLRDLVDALDESLAMERGQQDAIRGRLRALALGDPDENLGVTMLTSTPSLRTGSLAGVDAVSGPILEARPALRALISDVAAEADGTEILLASFFSDVLDNLREFLREMAEALQPRLSGDIRVGEARRNPELLAAVAFHDIALNNRIQAMAELREATLEALAILEQALADAGVPEEGPDDG